MKIAVVGIGYIGLSLGVLLSQYSTVHMVDIVKEKVDLVNMKKSPIADKAIEQYLQKRIWTYKQRRNYFWYIKMQSLLLLLSLRIMIAYHNPLILRFWKKL